MKLYTNRCYLLPITQEDFKDIKILYSDEITRKFLGGTVLSLDFENKFKLILEDKEASHWIIKSTLNKIFIGLITLDLHHDRKSKEISYQLISNQFKKGYAFEVMQIVIRYCFESLKLDKVIAETQSSNIKSIQLLKKTGFTFDKTLYRFGESQDLYIISKN
ncbi:MAG: GNAT family N-acetyltransferase [Candidatus Cloacimonadota bacterium]|nr:MAG: GNAT family N-acetyltransferase [Candidatus Cloacimonadota bacterium]